jgi:predicted DsbA family dithiol-disulfide isomerase
VSTARRIDQEYVKSGQVRIVVKNLADGGGLDTLAAQAALCASDQGKFWEYHDRLMESYYVGNRDVFSPAGIIQVAVDLGLDAAAFATCLDQGKYTQRVIDEAAEARKLGVTGTPSFFVNDIKILGAQPYPAFQAAIEEALRAK